MKTKNKIILALVLGVPFLVLAVIFGMYDLKISQTVVNMSSSFGNNMEAFGELVSPILFAIAGEIIVIYAVKNKDIGNVKLNIAVGCISILVGVGYSIIVLKNLPLIMEIIIYASILIVYLLLGILFFKLNSKNLYSMLEIAVITVIYLVALVVFINVFKFCWGRVRYRDMVNVNEFTPWYKPHGLLAGNFDFKNRSFPSGHTANASALYVVTMLSALTTVKWKKVLCYVLPVAWILVMASSRVLVGAHFASDVLFGGAISITIFYIVKHFIQKNYFKAEN